MGLTDGILGAAVGSSLGGALGGIFGGDKGAKMAGQGLKIGGEATAKGQSALNPWLDSTDKTLGGYEHFLDAMMNPEKTFAGAYSKYQVSPWAQGALKRIQGNQDATAAASGMSGTPASQEALASADNSILNKDFQNQFGDMMNMLRQGAMGLGHLSDEDLWSARNYGEQMQQALRSGADMLGQQMQYASEARTSGGGLLGGIVGGALGSALKL